MRRRVLMAGAMLAILVAIQPAAAQTKGTYLSGAAGLSLMRDSDLDGTGINTSVDVDRGAALSAAVGHAYGNGWRAEVELNYRNADADTIGGTAASGDLSAFGLMLNGYYDFDTGTPWTPYLGGGIGGAHVTFDGVTPVGGSRIDDSDSVFAYQGIAGLSYKLSDATDAFAEYRYFGTTDPNFTTDAGTSVDADFGEHRIMLGLRFMLGAPKPMPKAAMTPVQAPAPPPAPPPPAPRAQPAPPPPPAAPPAPRRFLVFFDWDRSDLTADAKAIILQAAGTSRQVKVTQIVATGHADRSGPDAYNMGLSQRRARSVQAELVRLGVPPSEIVVRWRGEREPLVPTPDGVREPQNRRVEILLN